MARVSGAVLNGEKMKSSLMTFNVLNAWLPNSAVYKTMRKRSEGAASFILRELPDILCLQEFDYYYRHDGVLMSAISDKYAEADTQDEIVGKSWNCIFYRKDKFSIVASGGYNFTANGFAIVPIKDDGEPVPEKACNCHPYRYPENSEEGSAEFSRTRFRSFGWAVLEDDQGDRLLVTTTHLSLRKQCQGNEVEFVLGLLKELQKKYGCAALLCGDLNSAATWGGAKMLIDKGLFDTFDMADEKDDIHSCHQTSGKGTGEPDSMPGGAYKTHAIDHIFTDRRIGVSTYKIYAEEELLAVSDHCPTMIKFEL